MTEPRFVFSVHFVLYYLSVCCCMSAFVVLGLVSSWAPEAVEWGPAHVQARGRTRQPNLALAYFVLWYFCVPDEYSFSLW